MNKNFHITTKENLKNNLFLKEAYKKFYEIIFHELKDSLNEKILEIGGGDVSFREFYKNPKVVSSDIVFYHGLDLVCSAEKLPFAGNSFKTIVMCNVFHHIKKPSLFLEEAVRILKAKGKIVMIEPSLTIAGKWIRRCFHHENLNDKALSWEIGGTDPLSSNLANPWIVFKRDIKIFNEKFPSLELTKFESHTPLMYLLSGGANHKFSIPQFMLFFIKIMEKLIYPLNSLAGMHTTIIIRKTK